MARISALILLAVGVTLTVVGTIGFVAAAVAPGGVNRNLLIGAVVVEVLGAGMLVWAVILLRRTRPIGGTAAGGGRTGAYLADSTETGDLDGSAYTVHYQTPVRGKNGRPSSLMVGTPVVCDCEFRITGETGYDRLCKNIGLAVEIQTGDPAFDEVCYVRTDSVAFTEAYLQDPIKRVAIVDMRRLGFPEVSLSAGKVEAKWVGFDPDKHDKPDLAVDAAARLVLLSRDLPQPQPEFEQRTGGWRKQWQFVLWPLLIAFALTIFSMIPFTPLHFVQVLARAAVPLALGLPAFAFLSAVLLRGTSRSHIAWGRLMIGAIFLFPPGSMGTVGLVNGVTDTSPEETHDALIVRKYTTRSKNSTNYHVECQSWREPGETEKFGISVGDYKGVVERRSKLRATTHAGGLGIEWLVSKQVLE